ncbi:uncharacterized protein MEPE_02897 [Melanopsichium pennsylvanicum]|uniref:Rsm22-domain-containing protein n=2 Tax=Melanopsichium pennsylvanicum TaxID=63383 RepID=A0AAJ4XK25_9BASI|nr:rsm22-domain-containing protein [Melanopsichium pennsylvanicum 4]SNX84189.1 uncharacterized protein MEPE_02897 [Melanopsichium pennsylvanicum]
MKAILCSSSKGSVPAARFSGSARLISSSSSATSSRAAALAKAAEASITASERLYTGNRPIVDRSHNSHQTANRLDLNQSLLSDHDEASAYFNLSSSQARRSRAARFGTSRHVTYASPLLDQAAAENSGPATEEFQQGDELALAYASPTGTSTSSIYLPEYVAWAITQLITAANDPKLLRADHLKLAHLTDPQQHMAEAAHIPPKRSSLLHLATVSPHRYAAIVAVFSEVRQRLSSTSLVQGDSKTLQEALPRWTPDTVLDFDCAAGEGLWAAAQVFGQSNDANSSMSLKNYHGYDRRPNLLKSGKKVAQSASSNVSPADPPRPEREVRLRHKGEQIQVDGVTYYEQEPCEEAVQEQREEENQPTLEYFLGAKSAMASVQKTFQSVPLAKDLALTGSGGGSLALSAFALSLMTNDSNRFEAVQAMWDSGAQVIVIIDSATPRGFASVASARAQLIQLGKQTKDGIGAHVVAPCSHDKPCPLLHPFAINSSVASAVGARSDTGNLAKSKEVCGFTARYHTPTFLRRTKHSDRGEENVGYSYVVVRRGQRPSLLSEAQRRMGIENQDGIFDTLQQLSTEARKTKTGILDMLRNAKKVSAARRMLEEVDTGAALTAPLDGINAAVEYGEMSDEQAKDQLLALLPDAMKAELSQDSSSSEQAQLTPEQLDSIMASLRNSLPSSPRNGITTTTSATTSDASRIDQEDSSALIAADEEGMMKVGAPSAESELAMRLESYSWPRLIKSPLKKGGHVTLDACCASGNIERFTISKASGKQAYQDARKSKWGDLFPHPSRSKSVVKVLNPLTALEYQVEMMEGCQGGKEVEGKNLKSLEELAEKLVLRTPSKMQGQSASGGVGVKTSKSVQVVGLEEGEDVDLVLREFFEDMDDLDLDVVTVDDVKNHSVDVTCSTISGIGSSSRSRKVGIESNLASYRLISPNIVTPTRKQEKRINVNYSKKWDASLHNHQKNSTNPTHPAISTNLNTPPTVGRPNSVHPSSRFGDDSVEMEQETFKSSLQSFQTWSSKSKDKVGRSSRKKSRGGWDDELFGCHV